MKKKVVVKDRDKFLKVMRRIISLNRSVDRMQNEIKVYKAGALRYLQRKNIKQIEEDKYNFQKRQSSSQVWDHDKLRELLRNVANDGCMLSKGEVKCKHGKRTIQHEVIKIESKEIVDEKKITALIRSGHISLDDLTTAYHVKYGEPYLVIMEKKRGKETEDRSTEGEE